MPALAWAAVVLVAAAVLELRGGSSATLLVVFAAGPVVLLSVLAPPMLFGSNGVARASAVAGIVAGALGTLAVMVSFVTPALVDVPGYLGLLSGSVVRLSSS